MVEAIATALLSNALFALLLAVLAFVLQRLKARPEILHALWFVVLLRLLVPPHLHWPVIQISPLPFAAEEPIAQGPTGEVSFEGPSASALLMPVVESPLAIAEGGISFAAILLACWAAVSLWLCIHAIRRHWQFERRLFGMTELAGTSVHEIAAQLRGNLGLQREVPIWICRAQLTPFVWAIFGRPRIVLPSFLMAGEQGLALRAALAHELARIKRLDHRTRWAGFLATTLFFWNPLSWLAQRKLREAEEYACDALALSALRMERRGYARSLIGIAEQLIEGKSEPLPAMSPMAKSGDLERRVQMIMNDNSRPARFGMRALLVGSCLALLPVGFGYAQDFEAVGKRLREAVKEGELSEAQARVMMEALRAVADRTPDSKQSTPSESRAQYAAMEERLKAAVKRGELTEAEAKERLEVFGRELRGKAALKEAAEGDARAKYRAMSTRLKAAVERGELTEAEAKERLEVFGRELREKMQRELEKKQRDQEKKGAVQPPAPKVPENC